jgi:hypothetical protein
MPLIEIKNEDAPTASVKCPCGRVNDHALATLQLGASAEEIDQIVLPPCRCGSQEFLIRTFDGEDDAHAGHRRAVNSLAGFLKGAGRVHPAAAERLRVETARPRLTRALIGPV